MMHTTPPTKDRNRSFSYNSENGLNMLKITRDREDIKRITENYIDVVLQRQLEMEKIREREEVKSDLIMLACIFSIFLIFYGIGLYFGFDFTEGT